MSGVAAIDRRVEVTEGSDDQRASIRRVSDLRPLPFVVLLGEPGIGKSTVFDVEAAGEGAPVLKVRNLMTGAHPDSDVPLFLDALDEYRSDGQPSDKVYRLANAIAAAKVPRWRLSCRSEDWRKGADIAPLQYTTGGVPIVAAQLLPLDHFEAMAVLVALGEEAPDEFLVKAAALGANGFIENPLSLKLLHKAVAGGGDWPTTRYELFETAIGRLAHEFNELYRLSDRSPPADIIAAAAKACLVLLASGSRAFWRSNAEPPAQNDDRRAYVIAHDLWRGRRLLRDVLDTALFRGEGEAFEPMHRTVAEFLAGQALADAVNGDGDRAALPLSRALAMITGDDRRPPTELRGLYAWLAAHLAMLRDEAGAMRMIEADAMTVLAYGDAAVFTTPARRAILSNLTPDDSSSRTSEIGVTAVGGLAGEDLAADFAAVLTGAPDLAHCVSTVLEALIVGPPVTSIRPLLRTISLDPLRSGWQRWRAADAWLHGAADPAGAGRALFDDLAGEPISAGREDLRAHLAAALPSSALSIADIKSLIADFRRLPDDHTVGSLWLLRQKLEAEPRPELFDDPTNTWLPRERHHSFEVDDLLDHVLAASIRKTPNLTGARLWRWTVNVRDYVTSELGTETAKAVIAWIDERQGRDVELFDVVLSEDCSANGPWLVGNIYTRTVRRRPSAAVIRHVLAKAVAAPKAEAKRLLEVAVAIVRQPGADIDAFWETYGRVADRPGFKALLKKVTTTEVEPWRREGYKRAVKRLRQHAKHKSGNIKLLKPLLGDFRTGQRPEQLDWAAQLYFDGPRSKGEHRAGVERIVHFTDQSSADAILAGWEYLATVDLVGVDAVMLGTAEAENRRYGVEWPAIAGLDHLFEKERLPDLATMPITLAIVVIRWNFIAEHPERRTQLQQWAIRRLNLNPTLGASQLVAYFGGILDAGGTQLNAIHWLSKDSARGGAVAQAIDQLVATRPSMPAMALHSVLWAAAKHLDALRLQALARAALADPAVIDRQRTLWTFVEFMLNPVGAYESLVTENCGSDIVELFDEPMMDGFVDAFHEFDGGTRVHREAMVVRFLGRSASPEDELVSGWVTGAARLSSTVRRAIWSLASCPHADAGTGLAGLIEDVGLAAWHPRLRDALAQQTRLRRDRNFKHPTPTVVRAAVDCGPPVNAADLRAVVIEELERLRAELRSNDTTPWKRYWNLDSQGKPTDPRIENECRDHLLERLQDRLKSYRIAAAVPEARRGEETRVDMLMLTGTGRNLPVEAKRHFHHAIWTAASTQLQGYAAADGADGRGIYLVFWFGNEASPTPARPDGSDGPTSAHELETMLVSDLPPELRARTDVIVFDVSNPEARATAAPRKRRRATSMGTAAAA